MLFGSSGIRQIYSPGLVRLCLRVGALTAPAGGSVVLGRDTRITGIVVRDAAAAGMRGAGIHVHDGGIAPTPAVAYAARHHDAGCMVTASHNPEEWNGLKLISPDGSAFDRALQGAIEDAAGELRVRSWDVQGTTRRVNLFTPYRDALLAAIPSGRGMTVVTDCGSGAGSAYTPAILKDLGHRVVAVNSHKAGRFPRPSEPLPTSLAHLPPLVRDAEASCAVVHDGDADRMMAVDREGGFLTGDQLLILFARYLGAKRVVTTTDASMAIEEVAEVMRTPVGDSYVSQALRGWGDFGGEPSGAWIFPRHSLCPDGPYAAALFCAIASEWDIGEELASIPAYPLIRESIAALDAHGVLATLGAESPTGGVRITEEDGWCLVRASGTEPKIRITSEGRDRQTAVRLMEKGKELVRSAKNA